MFGIPPIAALLIAAALAGGSPPPPAEKSPAHRHGFGEPVQRQTIIDRKGFRAQARYERLIDPPGADVLEAIRYCESGGDYQIVDASGVYTGAYQFDDQAWALVGGSGRAYEAPPKEQDIRAARLYRRMGPAPWPVCGV